MTHLTNHQSLTGVYTSFVPPRDKTNNVAVRPAKTQWVAKGPSFLHVDSEDSDQTGRMPRLIWVFAGRTLTLLVLSRGGSFVLPTDSHFLWAYFLATIERVYKMWNFSASWLQCCPMTALYKWNLFKSVIFLAGLYDLLFLYKKKKIFHKRSKEVLFLLVNFNLFQKTCSRNKMN